MDPNAEKSIYRTQPTLLQRIRNKDDHRSWEEFVSFYERFIYVTIRNMNVSHHDTEDLSQKVLLKVLDGIHSFEYQPGKHRFRSWLCRVTKNTVLNYIKKKKRQSEKMVDSAKTDLCQYLAGITVPDVEALADKEWRMYLFNYALAAVADRFQDNVIRTFELFLEGYDSKEIAERMSLNQNTVLVYRKRVKEQLSKEIKRLDYEHS